MAINYDHKQKKPTCDHLQTSNGMTKKIIPAC